MTNTTYSIPAISTTPTAAVGESITYDPFGFSKMHFINDIGAPSPDGQNTDKIYKLTQKEVNQLTESVLYLVAQALKSERMRQKTRRAMRNS
jgi:hypothetical protein